MRRRPAQLGLWSAGVAAAAGAGRESTGGVSWGLVARVGHGGGQRLEGDLQRRMPTRAL